MTRNSELPNSGRPNWITRTRTRRAQHHHRIADTLDARADSLEQIRTNAYRAHILKGETASDAAELVDQQTATKYLRTRADYYAARAELHRAIANRWDPTT